MASSKGRAFGHSHVMDDVDLPFSFFAASREFYIDHKKGKKKIGKYW